MQVLPVLSCRVACIKCVPCWRPSGALLYIYLLIMPAFGVYPLLNFRPRARRLGGGAGARNSALCS